MKAVKALSLVTLAVLAANAYADPLQDQINQLQNEINQLQTSIQQKQAGSNWSMISLDSALPFATLSKNNMPMQLLANKAKGIDNGPVVLGGQVEGDVQYWDGDHVESSNYQDGSGIYLKRTYLFAMANPNDWTTTMLAVKRASNNTVQVERGFIILGNLTTTPVYLTTGYTYLPFGAFSGNGPVHDTLTTDTFRVSPSNQVVVGYDDSHIMANFGFYNSTYRNNINDFLADLGFAEVSGELKYGAAIGYLNDVRGTNSEVGSAYALPGASPSSSAPYTGAANSVLDVNAQLAYGAYGLLGEYVTTTKSAEVNNVATGKLSSWMLGANYKTGLYNIPTTFQLSYSATENMQNLPYALPGEANGTINTVGTSVKNQWLASVEGEVLTNFFVGPEFDYSELYTGQKTYAVTLDMNALF